jgi:hypothetical protein
MSMNNSVECLRCHTVMELGYVADVSQGGYLQQRWAPGSPEPSFWTGLKAKKDQSVPIVTLRCPDCGYLESYASRKSFPTDSV